MVGQLETAPGLGRRIGVTRPWTRNPHGGKLDEGEKGGAQLFVAGGYASELLELVEEALDVVALAVDGLLPPVLPFAVGAVGNVGDRVLIANADANPIGVIALVGDDNGTLLEPVEQRLGMRYVVVVARRDQEADRAALRIDAGVDLRGEAASTSAHATSSTLFLTPEAC